MVWQARELPQQTGRTVVITGGNSGIGLEAANVLAQKGARVIIACRDETRAAAASEICKSHARARVETATLNLASLGSVRACAEGLARCCGRLDVLINNAGVMAIP